MALATESDISMNKTTCDKYDIISGDDWAKIILCNEEDSILCVMSSFGDWNYSWGAHVYKDYEYDFFKEFLTVVDLDYLWGTLAGYDSDYNHEKTLENYRSYIFKEHDSGYYSQYTVDLLLSELKVLKNKSDIAYSSVLKSHIDNYPMLNMYQSDISHKFRLFFNKLWVIFINCLHNELENEDNS